MDPVQKPHAFMRTLPKETASAKRWKKSCWGFLTLVSPSSIRLPEIKWFDYDHLREEKQKRSLPCLNEIQTRGQLLAKTNPPVIFTREKENQSNFYT